MATAPPPPHQHPHRAEAAPGPSRGASVVLDIGPHAGALVVYAPAGLEGSEIEIRARGEAWGGGHTAVRARHVGANVVHAGLFDSLAPGPYDLRPRGAASETPAVTVDVVVGTVTSIRLDSARA